MLSARVYRRAHALRAESTGCAVLVQKMLEPAVSGVGFTINPVTGHDGEVWITASWGLGEAVIHTSPSWPVTGLIVNPTPETAGSSIF